MKTENKNASLSLYEITNNRVQIEGMLEQLLEVADETQSFEEQYVNAGIVSELTSALEITEADFTEKVEVYCEIIGNEQSAINAIDAEIKRLTALKRHRETKVNYLKKNISEAMKVFGKVKVDLKFWKLSFRSSKAVVVDETIVNPDTIPEKYLKLSIAYNKTDLKKALEAGESYEGVYIEERQNLQIK